MNCGCTGESTAQMLQGKMAYIEGAWMRLVHSAPAWLPAPQFLPASSVKLRGTGTGTVPPWRFMLQELRAGETWKW